MRSAQALASPTSRPPLAKPDRRQHKRVKLRLDGRFMADDTDHTLITTDVSCGGACLAAQVKPAEGTAIVCYFDDLGRVTARVVRHVADGFAVAFEVGAHKRAKLADRLVWLLNKKKYGLTEERSAPRKPAHAPALITRANGLKVQCRVIDISLTGAAFEAKGPAPFVGEIIRAGTLRGEVVRSIENEFAIRFLHKVKTPEQKTVT